MSKFKFILFMVLATMSFLCTNAFAQEIDDRYVRRVGGREVSVNPEFLPPDIGVATSGEATTEGAGSENAGSNGSGGADVFDTIASKVTSTLADLRYIAYIIAGFGIIVFAYGAIFGKLSWKHLANIAIGLFLIAMMAPFIEYFTYSKAGTGSQLKYGSYLAADYEAILYESSEKECIAGPDGECMAPETPGGNTELAARDMPLLSGPKLNLSGLGMDLEKESQKLKAMAGQNIASAELPKKKYGLKDLWGSVKKVADAATTAAGMYNGAKNTIQAFGQGVSTLGKAKDALLSGNLGGMVSGVTGGLSALDQMSSLAKDSYINFGNDIANVSNQTQDIFATNDQRKQNEHDRYNKGETTNAVSEWIKNNRDQNAEKVQAARDKGKKLGDWSGDIDNVYGQFENVKNIFSKKK